jgi:hypothetical protein
MDDNKSRLVCLGPAPINGVQLHLKPVGNHCARTLNECCISATPFLASLVEVAPQITASVSPGNVVLVKFRRGTYNGVVVEAQIDNAVDWTGMGRFVRSPATLEVPVNPNNLPRQVEIRARFLTGNDPVGDWSDTVTVQTIP